MTKAKIIGIHIVGARVLTDNKVVGRTRTNKELLSHTNGIFHKAIRVAAEAMKEADDKRTIETIIGALSTKRQASKFRRSTGEVYQIWAKKNNIS